MNKPDQAATFHGSRLICVYIALLLRVLLWSDHASARPCERSVAAMVAAAMPAVVRIVTVGPANSVRRSAGRAVTGIGAGYIIKPSGYIGTNKHLISGATSVFAITADGERYRATIVGVTAGADIALLRIDAGQKPLPVVHFGDSDKMRVGDRVIAIGSPFGFDNSVTSGIVSGINRNITESPFDDYLQTDAAINHGNSGGPLFTEAGEVIGMTSVIFSPDRGSSGLGFAVPSNGLKFVFERLIKTGKIDAGMLPVHTQPVGWGLKQAFQMPDLQGALVTSVDDSAVKRLHKVQIGDVITAFNGQPVQDPRDLARKAARSQIGSDAELVLRRGDQSETVHLTIEAMPEAKPIPKLGKPRTLGLPLAGERRSSGDHIVKVASIDPLGTAAESGLQRGDTVVEIQHTPVTQPGQAPQVLRDATSATRHFAAVLVRDGQTLSWLALELPDSRD